MPRLITSRWMRENQFSTWFNHEKYVGLKCIRTLRCAARKSSPKFGSSYISHTHRAVRLRLAAGNCSVSASVR